MRVDDPKTISGQWWLGFRRHGGPFDLTRIGAGVLGMIFAPSLWVLPLVALDAPAQQRRSGVLLGQDAWLQKAFCGSISTICKAKIAICPLLLADLPAILGSGS